MVSMAAPHEIELKLEFEPGDLERVSRHISVVAGTPDQIAKRLKSTYFDTTDGALRRRGLSLRVRKDGDESRQTLKSGRDGLFDRREWECPVTAERPEVRLFKKKPRKLIDGHDLRPVFTTDIRRTIWQVDRGASQIEIALDDGEVRAGETIGRVAEIEIELVSGLQADLFDVAKLLAIDVPLRVGVRSKSERGYTLSEPAGRAAKAEAIEFDPAATAAVAFQVVARSCLRQFRLNEAMLPSTRDPDALHQARVAIRRLRSALSIFRKMVADDEVDAIKRRLKEFAVTLGTARNLDVFRASMIEPPTTGDDAAQHACRARINAARDVAYAQVSRMLGSQDFRAFVLELTGWIESGPWITRPENATARDRRIYKFANGEIDRRTRSVLKKGRGLETTSAEARHDVRIAAKKLRYASEFFASLTSGRKAKRHSRAFIRKLEALQDALGAVNDIQTGRDLTRDLMRDVGGTAAATDFAVASGHPTGEQVAQERELIAAAVDAFAKFRQAA